MTLGVIRGPGILFSFLLVAVLPSLAQSPKDVERSLEAKYKGKTLTRRNFSTTNSLLYTRDGRFIDTADIGTWTLYGLVEIKDVSVKKDQVEIQGNRIAVLFEPKNRRLERFRTGVKFRLRVEYEPGMLDESSIETAIARIFLGGNESFVDLVPPYWKDFLLKKQVQQPSSAVDSGTENNSDRQGEGSPVVESVSDEIGPLYRVGNNVTPPSILYKVDPSYTLEARASKHQGTVILKLVVRRDGKPVNLELEQPLGLGLDEAAIEAVREWRFNPALRDGVPVSVQAAVEVSFRLTY